MNTDPRPRLPVRTLSLLLAVAGATLLPASQAAAERVRYCVVNSSDTHGLYTNDVYYSPQCNGADRKCLSREHFFSFGDAKVDQTCSTTLTVDYGNAPGAEVTAVLHGRVGGNKNTMNVDVDLEFRGLRKCVSGDPVLWPRKWGVFPQNDTVNPPLDDSLDYNLYCAATIRDAEPDGIPAGDVDGGFGGFGQDMDQQVDPTGGTLQLGLGGNGLKRTVVGAYANFKVNVPGSDGVVSPKTWELGMTLVKTTPPVDPPPPPPQTFDIVLCPSDGTVDDGAGEGEEVAGRKDCTICWYGEKSADGTCADETFVTTFKNEPGMWGQITLDGRHDIPDPRVHCNPDAAPTAVNPVGAHTVAPGVTVAVDAGAKPGLTIAGSAMTGSVYVPWYVCGIPGEATGLPFIRLINADSDFLNTSENPDFRDVVNSVVLHDADGASGSQNADFECTATDQTNRDPVVAWLPRTDEIPLPDASRQMRDVTSACGSTRGGSSTRSYLLSNLVYDDSVTNADFRAIIGAEIDMLEATLVSAGAAVTPAGALSSCVDVDQNVQSILFPDPYEEQGQSRYVDHIRNNFNSGDYANVMQKLEDLLGWLGAIDGTTDTLDPTADLFSAFDTCYYKDGTIYNLTQYPALDGAYPPVDSGYIPRNFRGDLQAQVEHILWNMRQNLLAKP